MLFLVNPKRVVGCFGKFGRTSHRRNCVLRSIGMSNAYRWGQNTLASDEQSAYSSFDRGLSEQAAEILRDVEFGNRRGEILGLVGESGSGKTTACVLALLGLLDHKGGKIQGEIQFDGRDLPGDATGKGTAQDSRA